MWFGLWCGACALCLIIAPRSLHTQSIFTMRDYCRSKSAIAYTCQLNIVRCEKEEERFVWRDCKHSHQVRSLTSVIATRAPPGMNWAAAGWRRNYLNMLFIIPCLTIRKSFRQKNRAYCPLGVLWFGPIKAIRLLNVSAVDDEIVYMSHWCDVYEKQWLWTNLLQRLIAFEPYQFWILRLILVNFPLFIQVVPFVLPQCYPYHPFHTDWLEAIDVFPKLVKHYTFYCHIFLWAIAHIRTATGVDFSVFMVFIMCVGLSNDNLLWIGRPFSPNALCGCEKLQAPDTPSAQFRPVFVSRVRFVCCVIIWCCHCFGVEYFEGQWARIIEVGINTYRSHFFSKQCIMRLSIHSIEATGYSDV